LQLHCNDEVFFKAISQSALAALFGSGLIFRVRSIYCLVFGAYFSRNLKIGHVHTPGLDIALKNASPLQRAKVYRID